MTFNEPAFTGRRENHNHAVQVGDGVIFTQGILEGLTGVVSESSSSGRFLVAANNWPSGVRVAVPPNMLRKLRPVAKPSHRVSF